MNWETFVTSELVADLGWTLVHSLWQIALVALVLEIALRSLRHMSANAKYGLSVAALVIAFTFPGITFIQLSANSPAAVSNHAAGSSVARHGTRGVEPLVDGGAITPASASWVSDGTSSSVFSYAATFFGQRVADILPIAVGLWLLGVAAFAIRLGGGLWQLTAYRTRDIGLVDGHWKEVFETLKARLNIKHNVELLRSTIVETPIAIGVLKPMIVVPASLFLQMHPRELETIIAHELIHIRRYDPLVNILQSFVETVLFYHPCVWWMSAQIRREREFAADAEVMEIFGDSHTTYARALANLEEIRRLTDQQLPRFATAANGGNLMQRIQKILNVETETSKASSAWTAGLALLLTSAVLLAIFSFNPSNFVNAQSRNDGRKLAIGFVSIPPVDRSANAPKDAEATARLLIDALKRNKVPATGFLQGGMISDGEKFYPVRKEIARMWIDAGFELGLGGFKHISLYDVSPEDYIDNLEKNEMVAKKLLGDMGSPPRYFSYPFLNTGKTVDDRAKVEAWLAQRGYTPVKYSFDNQEWMYSWAYDMARNDNDINTMKEIRESYLAYMSRMFDHYEAYSREMFGRDIAQTMVLTPGRLITDTADEFFAMARKRGYSFISVDEAQGDPAYKTLEDFTGKAGISWFERWSMAKGRPLRDEPRVDASVERIWQARTKK